jgi:nitric oxide synthase oxygenase domain/subunit
MTMSLEYQPDLRSRINRFMDAEIGVRNLGDTFRYNVLPDVVKALRLDDEALLEVDSFEDLPEYQQLAMLVCHSSFYLQPYLMIVP